MTNQEKDLLIAEYCALREEVLKRIELRFQMTSLALVALATLIGVGFQNHDASIILLYPILAVFLLSVHISNSFEIQKMTDYIRDHVELKAGIDNIGWQHYRIRPDIDTHKGLAYSGVRATLVASGLVAFVAGLSLLKIDTKEIVLLILDSVSTFLLLTLSFRQEILFKLAVKLKKYYRG